MAGTFVIGHEQKTLTTYERIIITQYECFDNVKF